MADFGGVNILTPQEVLARLQAQRDQFRMSGDPQVRRQAVYDQALDTLFGNPQLQAAQKVTEAVTKAQTNIKPMEGEDDLAVELRRLKAMRDAVGQMDPAAASQINQRMLQVGAEQLERRKLLADMDLKQRENARQEGEYAMKAGEYAMKAEEFPLDQQMKRTQIAEKNAETQNYINPRTGEMVNVKALDSIAIKQLQQAGWVKAGVNIQADDPSKLNTSKKTTDDLQKNFLESQGQLDNLSSIMTKYDPSFLQLPTQVLNSAASVGEKLGLNVGDAARRAQYYEFRRNSIDAFNRYIKFITGAQMSEKEAARIQKAFPDAEKDSNTQFLAKLREATKQTMQVQARAREALRTGLNISGDQWDQVQLPNVSDAQVDAFLQQSMGVPPRAGAPKTGQKSSLDAEIDSILGK